MTMQLCYGQQSFEQDKSKEDPGDVGVAPSKVRSLCKVCGEEATKDTGGAWVEPQGSPSGRASSMEIGLGLSKTKMRVLGSIQQDDPPPERRPRKRLRRAGATIVEDGSPSTDEEERKILVRGAMRTIQGLCRTRAEKCMTREAVLTTLDKILLTVISPHGRPDRAQPPAIPLRNKGKVPPCARCKEHRFPRQGRAKGALRTICCATIASGCSTSLASSL
jgi:hypothetical protein